MTHRVAILISGGGSNMVALARSMQGDHPGRCALVIANEPDAGGLDRAREMGIATAIVDHRLFESRQAFEDALHERLVAAGAEVICLAGFMRILTAGFVARWQGAMLNIHPSLLPKYKGLDTHARALAAGDAQAGCSVHLVTPELDDGPILGQRAVPIKEGDTPQTLAARVLEQEHNLYPAVVRDFLASFEAAQS